jgi:tetratricopeptide (TPR) repeat protein
MTNKSRWARTLAISFAALFAIFWSLGSFFFWLLLGCSVYFTFLSIYFSDTQFNFFAGRQDNRDPDTGYRGPDASRGGTAPNPAVRAVRIIVFSVIGFFTFLFFVGIFFGEDVPEDNDASATQETNETSAAVSTDDNSKGNAFFNDGNYDSALWYYDRVLVKNPDDQDGLYNKSLVHAMNQRYSESIPLVRRCLQLYPNYNEAWWLLGYDYNAINNLDSAVYSVERAYNNDFKETSFLELMGEIYSKTGARDKAKEFYLKVIEKDSDNINACKALIELDPDNAARYQERINESEQSK